MGVGVGVVGVVGVVVVVLVAIFAKSCVIVGSSRGVKVMRPSYFKYV